VLVWPAHREIGKLSRHKIYTGGHSSEMWYFDLGYTLNC